MNARTLILALLPVLSAVGCTKPFMRDSMPTKEDANTKPETLVALGDVRHEAALAPNRKTSDKDGLESSAILAYRNALERDPANVPALLGLGRVYSEMNDREKAVASYQAAIKTKPQSAAVWYELGCCHGRFKDWDAACNALQQANQFEPDNLKYRKMMGMTLARAGRFDEAYAWLSRSMSEADARYNMGRMLAYMNKPEESRQQYGLALRADPNYEPAKEQLAAMAGGGGTQQGSVVQAGFVQR